MARASVQYQRVRDSERPVKSFIHELIANGGTVFPPGVSSTAISGHRTVAKARGFRLVSRMGRHAGQPGLFVWLEAA